MSSTPPSCYDIKSAKTVLEQHQAWVDDDKEYLHAIVKLPSGWENLYHLTYHSEPSSWRLVKQTVNMADEEESEELIFTLQGVIDSKNLPPILEDPKVPKSKAQFLQQSVTLTGLGTSTFEESVTALQGMHTIFSRQFPEGRLLPWQPSSSNLGPGSGFSLSNRYFTKRSEGPQMANIPFATNVDPKKYLTRMLSSALLHTEENTVQYFIRHGDLGSNFKYAVADPQNFRLGDIVEVQFSLVVYKMRTEHYILKPMLYSIALLEGKFANDLAKHQLVVPATTQTKSLKRKIGYIISMDETREKKMKKTGAQEPSEDIEGIAKMRLD